MKHTVLVALIVLAPATVARAQQKSSSELESYLESIKRSGISEVGRSQILTVAGIAAGATRLEYRKDEASGRYWPTYTSTTCPKPDADPPQIAQWKKLRSSESVMMVDKLKPYADADGSGFVTTDEASAFRDLVEFGYLVAQVNRDEGSSATLIARASGYDARAAAEKIKAYATLAGKIHDAGVTELPQVSMTAD